MNRRLPIAAATLLAATRCSRAGAAPRRATGVSPAHGLRAAPGRPQVRGAAARAGRGAATAASACTEAAAALRRSPRVAYAAPNYIATASASDAAAGLGDPQRPRPDPGPPGPARRLGLQAVELPALGRNGDGAAASLARRHRRGRRLAEPGAQRGGQAPRASPSPSSTPASPTAPRGARFRRSPDFGPGQFVKGYDFVDDDRLPLDENGHGTHVAGTIAEKTNNGIGLAGLAYRAKLMPVRVLDRHGSGQADEIARGIHFAVAHGADVINMSFNFGCGKKVPGIDEELRQAYRKGVVTVASIGNLGSEACVSPPATAPARDRRRRHHRGRLPRQLLAAPARTSTSSPPAAAPRIPGCPSVSTGRSTR